MIRVTTNGVLTGYKSGLMRARNQVNSARNQVLTQRNFNSFAEDPAAATRAFQLRRSAWEVDSQLSTSADTISKFESAFKNIMTINEDLGNQANGTILSGLNSATGSGRKALGKTLTDMADSILQSMNTKYGSTFIFSGSDGETVPFSWGANGEVLFRGLDVSDPDNAAALQKMADESTYVDIGLGFQEHNGSILPSSAFNSALSGLNAMGFGVDADADPKNLISIVKELGTILSRCSEDAVPKGSGSTDGIWAPNTTDQADAERLQKKLVGSLSTLRTVNAELTTRSSFLKTNDSRLDDTFDTLNEQIVGIEQIDLADAISNFSWAQYCYNAALKVGNSILSESLIDYMK